MLSLCLALIILICESCAEAQGQPRFHDPQNVHNLEHIKEHMGEYYQNENMTDELKLDSNEEMEFHYFKLHDYDGNNKLDGLELGAALTHFAEEDSTAGEHNIALDDNELSSLIDQVLGDDDLNDDGYIDYYEFTHAQQKNTGNDENAL